MSRVKIVATIGPATVEAPTLRALRAAGFDVARLNGSHADFEWHARTIALLRDILPEVPILLDIPGRKIRTGSLGRELVIGEGERVVLTTAPAGAGPGKIPVTYARLHADAAVGDTIVTDDGRLKLSVTEIAGHDVVCQALTAGKLFSGNGLHVPGATLRAPFLSTRDRQLMEFACEHAVDFVGLSFVESAAQVQAVRSMLSKQAPAIIAKVETRGALLHLEDIMRASDALMIDRGDLAMAIDVERIALVQKEVLAKAQRMACPVIVATEMLHSMITNPVPSKAEVSDIANAVLDGASAVMLSGETAIGQFPVDAVSIMRRVVDAAAGQRTSVPETAGGKATVPEAVADGIALMCHRLDVTKIVAVTKSGYAARIIAARRPEQPILAVTNDHDAVRRFNLLRGVKGIYVDTPFFRASTDHVARCLEALWRTGELVDEDLVVVTAVAYPKSGNRMNLIEMYKVADLRENQGWVRETVVP
jgi:pyruvate kinase